MDLTITVRVCDKCKRQDRPAKRYTLTPDEGRPIQRDLCDEDAAPVLDLFDLEAEKPQPASEAKPPAQRKATGKKATAKKATTRRGRTPVKTLAEIEAEKAARAKES
ncbi:hypothetical protein [Streptomyces sp. NPDC090021]|uniref:hypothetical protein n=1 Tax=Streptomyces sp. NPDC090021 TaxID=3365919 RepID=UPI0037F7EF42